MNKGPDCGKKLATRLRCKQVICNFAILQNCSGKWDSPSNNSIVCLLPPWIDFLLIITLLLPAGVHTHTHKEQSMHTRTASSTIKISAESSKRSIRSREWTSGCLSPVKLHAGYCSYHTSKKKKKKQTYTPRHTIMTGYCIHALTKRGGKRPCSNREVYAHTHTQIPSSVAGEQMDAAER